MERYKEIERTIIKNYRKEIWSRFIKTVYKDESYLMHTLPVTKNQIFNAKVFASILSIK